MSTDLGTHQAPRLQPRPKLELPPIVRDYLDHVRGNPEMIGGLLPDYLDRLWAQANEFAVRNAVPCPIHGEEVDALRAAIERRVVSQILSSAETALVADSRAGLAETTMSPAPPKRSFGNSADKARRFRAPSKPRRLSVPSAFSWAPGRASIAERGKGSTVGAGMKGRVGLLGVAKAAGKPRLRMRRKRKSTIGRRTGAAG